VKKPRTNHKVPLTDEQKKLVADNVRLAYWYIEQRSEWLQGQGIDRDDAIQFALLVMCNAARNYEPAKGKISSYFISCINFQFRRQVKASNYFIHLPEHKVTAGDFSLLPQVAMVGNFWDEGSGSEIADKALRAIEEPDEQQERTELADQLETALRRLPARDSDIVRYLFGVDGCAILSVREICNRFGISRQRVYQVKNRSLRKMRAVMESAA